MAGKDVLDPDRMRTLVAAAAPRAAGGIALVPEEDVPHVGELLHLHARGGGGEHALAVDGRLAGEAEQRGGLAASAHERHDRAVREAQGLHQGEVVRLHRQTFWSRLAIIPRAFSRFSSEFA